MPVAVISGSGGMGIACAKLFASTHTVVLLESSPARLDTALDEVEAAEGLICDVTDRASVEQAVARVRDLGRLDALVHTAGVITAETAARIFEINFVGTANVLDAFEPLVEEGTVAVCVASIGGHKPNTRAYDAVVLSAPPAEVWAELAAMTKIASNPNAAYSMSKRGVILLCERYAVRWGARGGRVVSISPGVITTPMTRDAMAGAGKAGNAILNAATPPRPGAPDEIASVVAFLVSPAASYVSGCDLRVDGGSIGNLLTNPDLQSGVDAWIEASAF